jgi:hypothetical protein
MVTELALLLALATLWGASYTFLRDWGRDHPADHPDRVPHADCRLAAAGDHALARGANAG